MSGSVFDRTPEQNALVEGWTPPEIDVSRAQSARMYDYYLGGKTNFAPDREAAEAALATFPSLRVGAQANRAFLLRLVRHLAGLGITQFLDIGTGIPIEGRNTHDVAQAIAPESRVVYVDNDPIVLAHARALMTGHPAGSTAYIDADVRDPDSILDHPALASTLDLTRPVAVLLVAVLHFIVDEDKPAEILTRLTDGLPSGSHLGLSHGTSDFAPEVFEKLYETYQQAGVSGQTRSRSEFAALVPDGWEITAPGVDLVTHWHPDDPEAPRPDAEHVYFYGLLARKR
ncbi:SAM-dependent methyltransferase [Yinghuangia sp. ASG 101]|uniref:SAM-dependent methyltransferase n=1 Tax=Yinghuangia sp. ASG 101 TaxID=2896848 RepID=UPI001E2EFE12|nr:SAM-dependent methyltransferase [Yinghuangia sp. ASG 101]UGQ13270.1 SAM-dependent methyltransferase [Yinghuangia sp. ASG 101]